MHLTRAATSRKARQLASRWGIHVRMSAHTRPVDLTNECDIDPVSLYYDRSTRPVIARVPLRQCIFSRHLAFPCEPHAPAPQVHTLIAYAQGHCAGYDNSPLKAFYDRFTPSCAAELMGLDNPSYAAFNALPPPAALLPWQPYSPDQAAQLRMRYEATDVREHNGTAAAARADKFFGPVPTSRGRLEFRRLVDAFASIKERGFVVDREGFFNISATSLVDDAAETSWRFFIGPGQHRIAALAALGHEYVDLQLVPKACVRKSDVAHWPAVRNGYFTEAEAEDLFDRLLHGVQPPLFMRVMGQT